MRTILKRITKKILNNAGVDIILLPKSPKYNLLGLGNFSIRSIIDGGGNSGQFARMISTIFPEAHIYCFEPLLEPFKDLTRWAKRQKNEKVKTFNLALGDREGVLDMFSHIEHSQSSSFLKTTKLCESFYPLTQKHISVPVKMTTLDQWAKILPNPPAPDILIKLDVQGYEDRVIRGGQKIFGIAKACILEVSLDRLYEDQATFKDIALLLYGIGYRYAGNLNQSYANDGHVIFIDAVFVKDH